MVRLRGSHLIPASMSSHTSHQSRKGGAHDSSKEERLLRRSAKSYRERVRGGPRIERSKWEIAFQLASHGLITQRFANDCGLLHRSGTGDPLLAGCQIWGGGAAHNESLTKEERGTPSTTCLFLEVVLSHILCQWAGETSGAETHCEKLHW